MNLRSALLPSLGVFAAAARHQNFAHAADELHLTASAVSHHVRKLEASLGVALFQRHARGVTLTGEGRLLADAASAAVSELDAVVQSLGRSDDRQRLRINTLHSLAHCWLLRSEEHTSELQSLMRTSYAVFCLQKKNTK